MQIVDEGTEKNAMPGGKMLEQVIRANLVAFIGGVRQSVNEVENVAHHRLLFLLNLMVENFNF
ncbi:hypothetical protein D3C72_2493110 [compost metagenome]